MELAKLLTGLIFMDSSSYTRLPTHMCFLVYINHDDDNAIVAGLYKSYTCLVHYIQLRTPWRLSMCHMNS